MGILCFEMLAGYPVRPPSGNLDRCLVQKSSPSVSHPQPFFDDNPMGIYEKILTTRPAFPSVVDPYAKDLIRRLLTVDRSKRLGNLRGGAMDVMMHPWFGGVDWGALERKGIRAPIVPPVMSAGAACSFRPPGSAVLADGCPPFQNAAGTGDTQNFQKYPLPRPEDLPGLFMSGAPPVTDAFGHLFEVRREMQCSDSPASC
jgi:protein kinase A